jgi:tripartite-type tricarboxylate transporter receptor subunit TctC
MAVTTGTRSDALPDIPAVKEFVPDYEATTWYGVGAPKKTLAEIVERLKKRTNRAVAQVGQPRLQFGIGAESLSMTCGEFAQFIAGETEKWGKAVKSAGVKAE